ncbi:MAG TPA: hypothetical protein IAC41_11790, partial [Candidatus Merdenecus merdavium]|nr:hypothetical protein [Candidatus Merdenecus merdavium]
FEQIAKSIYDGSASEIGRPERVSEKMMYKEMELPSQRLLNMPKCRAIFERYTESYPESWARKVIWAYHKLKEERGNMPFYWSDIRVLAGVKKVNMPKVMPFIPKYADKTIAEEIKNLVNNYSD